MQLPKQTQWMKYRSVTSTKVQIWKTMTLKRWASLPDIATTSEDSVTFDTYITEWLDDSFYKQNHVISNLQYAKLKLPNLAVKLLNSEPIIVLFDTEATFSCTFYHLFIKISKLTLCKKFLWVNTASRMTLGPIGIVLLVLDMNDHSIVHNFIICVKLKQYLIKGLHFAQEI